MLNSHKEPGFMDCPYCNCNHYELQGNILICHCCGRNYKSFTDGYLNTGACLSFDIESVICKECNIYVIPFRGSVIKRSPCKRDKLTVIKGDNS